MLQQSVATYSQIGYPQLPNSDIGFNNQAMEQAMSNQLAQQKLASTLIKIGVAIVVAALLWFFWYVQELLGGFSEFEFEMLACIFTSSGECGVAASIASLFSSFVYSPFVMWLGLALVAIGVVLKKISR